MESVTKHDARNLQNRSWGKVMNSESSVECFEIPCKWALWSVADTACCVPLYLQPHHAVCYSHTTLWPVTATPHCGLLQPHHIVACYSHTTLWPVTATPHCGLLQPYHIVACYSHTTLWPVTATSHHGLLPPHSAACYSHIASWSVTTT